MSDTSMHQYNLNWTAFRLHRKIKSVFKKKLSLYAAIETEMLPIKYVEAKVMPKYAMAIFYDKLLILHLLLLVSPSKIVFGRRKFDEK